MAYFPLIWRQKIFSQRILTVFRKSFIRYHHFVKQQTMVQPGEVTCPCHSVFMVKSIQQPRCSESRPRVCSRFYYSKGRWSQRASCESPISSSHKGHTQRHRPQITYLRSKWSQVLYIRREDIISINSFVLEGVVLVRVLQRNRKKREIGRFILRNWLM